MNQNKADRDIVFDAGNKIAYILSRRHEKKWLVLKKLPPMNISYITKIEKENEISIRLLDTSTLVYKLSYISKP